MPEISDRYIRQLAQTIQLLQDRVGYLEAAQQAMAAEMTALREELGLHRPVGEAKTPPTE